MKMKKLDLHCHVYKEMGFTRPNGTFYLLPEDAHKPCVNAGAESAEATKVVFKVKL